MSNLNDKHIIVVLGNWMKNSKDLNEESSKRLDLAIHHFLEYQCSLIITCGWDLNKKYDIPIAEAMKSYIINNSEISEKKVITENNSRDTVGDAIFTKLNFINKQELYNLIVITSDYHVFRTKKIFSYIFGAKFKIKVIGARTRNQEDFIEIERKSLDQFYKTFTGIKTGNDKLIFERLCKEHPYYNGDQYPRLEKNIKKKIY